MNKCQKYLLSFSIGNMNFFIIYIFIYSITSFFENSNISLFYTFILFWISVFTSVILKRTSMYYFSIIIIHLLAFSLMTLLGLYSWYNFSTEFWNLTWFLQLCNLQNIQLFFFIFMLLCYTIIWSKGIHFSYKKYTYQNILASFEHGIITLFFISLITLFLEPALKIEYLIFLYFLWSILAIALSKTTNWGNINNNSFKYILLFLFILISVSNFIIIYLINPLTSLAEMGITVSKIAIQPFLPFLYGILKFLIGTLLGFNIKQNPSNTTVNKSPVITSENINKLGWLNYIEKALLIISIALLIAIFIIIIIYLFRLLSKRNNSHMNSVSINIFELIKNVFSNIKYYVIKLINLLTENKSYACKTFNRLTAWGFLGGVDYKSNETPNEYAYKLSSRFPKFNKEIKIIVEYFCIEIYANKHLNKKEIRNIKNAWKTISGLNGLFIRIKRRLN